MGFKKLSAAAFALALAVSLLVAPPTTAKTEPRGTISGTVTLRGKPVAGALVIAHGALFDGRTTDSEGRFSITGPVGSYKVSAFSREHSSLETFAGGILRKVDAKKTKVREGRTTRLDIELAPAATVTGRVVDAEGQPVAGIRLETRNLVRGVRVHRIRTDGEGRYTATHLPGGRTEVAVAGSFEDGVRLGGRTEARAKIGRTVTAPDIRVVRPGTITAKVDLPKLARHDSVIAVNKAGDDSYDLEQDPKTGLWSAQVPPGTWHVTSWGHNAASTFVRVKEGETTHAGRLVIPAKRGVLTGTVLKKNGKPASQGRVRVYDSLGSSAGWGWIRKGGQFTVKGLAPGKHFVKVDGSSAYWDRTPPQRVQLTAGKTTQTTIKPRLKPRHTVRGQVVHRGKPVRGIVVDLVRSGGIVHKLWSSSSATRTNAKGQFTIRSMARGKYTLRIEDRGSVYRSTTTPLTIRGDINSLRIKITK